MPLIITAGLLGAALGTAIILKNEKSSKQAVVQDELVGKPVLAEENVEKLAEILILANGQTCVLKQVEGEWVVPDYYGLPINFSTLQRFVKSFTDAEIQRKVTSNSEVMQRFELTSNLVTFKGADGSVIKELSIGKTSESGDRFVQLDGAGPAFLMSFKGYINGDAQGWASKQIKGFEVDNIVKVSFESDDGTQVVANRVDAATAFTVEGLADGETAKASEVAAMVSKFATLFASNARALDDADAQAAKDHSRVIEFTDKEGAVHTYRVGRRPATIVADKAAEKDENNLEGEEQVAEELKPGPVFVFASSSDATTQGELQRYMSKATFEIAEHFYDSLPKVRSDWVETAPELSSEPITTPPIELPLTPASTPVTE